jgi:triphosphoribosyl-dephospho-CoA synthase
MASQFSQRYSPRLSPQFSSPFSWNAPLPLVAETSARTLTLDDAAIARHAVAALLAEVLLTPKPGLVDQRGSGAHRDLDLGRMMGSAQSLRPMFFAIARASRGKAPSQGLREQLGRLGREGERAMLAATDGSNTHRGAIWVVGLLAAGTAMMGATPAACCASAAEIARFTDSVVPVQPSNGQRVAQRYGVAGARGEACDGFPHVIGVGLPALRAGRARGLREQHARLDALMAIMAKLDDTCVLHRGGRRALDVAQSGARRVQQVGGAHTAAGMRALLELDAALLALNASPGGAADLLAATLFLDTISAEWPAAPSATTARGTAQGVRIHGTPEL